MLFVTIPEERIEIDSILFQTLIFTDVQGRLVHLFVGTQGQPHLRIIDVADRVKEMVRDEANGVAQIGRPQQWQHDVKATTDTIITQGLAKVFRVGLQIAVFCGRVKKTQYSDRRIKNKARQFNARLLWFQLQQVVGNNNRRWMIIARERTESGLQTNSFSHRCVNV